ncbi:MAG: hypothetical protein ABJC04_08665, partial [Verrucomicrobiota bacterium]
DNRSVMIHHEGSNLHYAIYYEGSFSSSSRSSRNTRSLQWLEDVTLRLKNGRTLVYLRESVNPDQLRINGREFDLHRGSVFVLNDDSNVEQLNLFPSLAAARDLSAMHTMVTVLDKVATSPAASAEALAESPKLQFLAWQDEWKTNQPGAARHPDGSSVTDATELKWLRLMQPAGYRSKPPLAFLHLWFSHPLFDQGMFTEVSLLNANGETIRPHGFGSSGSSSRNGDALTGNMGWLMYTLNPGEGTNMSARVTLRLRYTIGPLEATQEVDVTPKTSTTMSLEGEGELNGVGQNVDGRAFVAIAANAEKMKARRFGVVAVTKDGRELITGGSWSGGSDGTGLRVERFEFDVPLSEVAKFRIGTRPIRTMEWKDVVLPKRKN